MTNISVPMSNCKLKAGLYIVATPIGNLKDITLRALEVLQSADIVVCEDTRVTNKLLSHYGIKAKMFAYNDHNAGKVRPKILEQIAQGQSVALVSDAGTPMISDPGYKLINDIYEREYYVTTLPGASSVLAALTLAGLPTNRFLFEGFLPTKTTARKEVLQNIKHINTTIVFLERASRVAEVLVDILSVLGNREVAIAREITKSYEEVIKNTASELIEYLKTRDELKGEVVLVIGPPEQKAFSQSDIDHMLRNAMQDMRIKEAAAMVAENVDIPKKQLYARALELKNEQENT